MRFTGERVIPHRYELKPMLQEHIIRYEFALPKVQNKDILDLGCGCGYGTYLLACKGARSVVGVDVASDAIRYSREHYQTNPSIVFRVMDVTALEFPDNYFSGVVCFEVLEHVKDYSALLCEALRVLEPGGMFIISTPNKAVWSPNRHEPINPWHVREFSRQEFKQLVEQHLSNVRYFVQTTKTPGIIPFVLSNLRVQRYYAKNRSLLARLVELTHNGLIRLAMLPTRLIPGAMKDNPNFILPEAEVSLENQHYFIAVGNKAI